MNLHALQVTCTPVNVAARPLQSPFTATTGECKTPEVEVTLLGPVSVRVDGVEIALGGPKQRAVFALLALNAGQVVSLDRLIDALWRDEPPSRATLTLQSYVSRLRRILAKAQTGRDDVTQILSRPPGWVLTLSPQCLDVTRFESLLAQGRSLLQDASPDDAPAAARALQSGLELWTGEPVADLEAASFAGAQIARLNDLRWSAVESLLEANLLIGRVQEVADQARRFVIDNPFRERGWSALMVALYRTGRQSEAVEAAGQLRRTLAEELGLDPSPQLRSLEERILRHDPSLAEPARGPTPSKRSESAVAPAEGTAAQPFPEYPGTADAAVVGRDDVLASVDASVTDAFAGQGRVLVFDAPAGLGKSTMLDVLGERFRWSWRPCAASRWHRRRSDARFVAVGDDRA